MAATLTPDDFAYLLDQLGGRSVAEISDVTGAHRNTIAKWKTEGMPATMAQLLIYDAEKTVRRDQARLDARKAAIRSLADELDL